MYEYLSVYNSSVKNYEKGDRKLGHTTRVDIRSPQAQNYETIQIPIPDDDSAECDKNNDTEHVPVPNTTMIESTKRTNQSNKIDTAIKSVVNTSIDCTSAVGIVSILEDVEGACSDDGCTRIQATQNRIFSVRSDGTKSFFSQNQSVRDISSLEGPTKKSGTFGALQDMREDADLTLNVIGIEVTTQSEALKTNSKETVLTIVEVGRGEVVERNKTGKDYPVNRGFVLPYLPGTQAISNTRSSNLGIETISPDDCRQVFDSKETEGATNKNGRGVLESTTKIFRSAD